MIFYTADPHFGQRDIIEKAGRPFGSVEEMDAALVENWNSVVGDGDTVYLLGDIAFHGAPFPADYLSRLKGQKHLIRGNHDTGMEGQERFFEHFLSVSDYLETDDSGFHITLCHYPIVYIQRGYMIHGHIHRARPEIFSILEQLPRVMNAGVDLNHYRPVTLSELIANNREYYGDPERGAPDAAPGRIKKRTRGWEADFRPLPVKK